MERVPTAGQRDEPARMGLLVGLSNLLYGMTPEERSMLVSTAGLMVAVLESLDRDTGPEIIYAKETGKVVVVFNGAGCEKLDPIVLNMAI